MDRRVNIRQKIGWVALLCAGLGFVSAGCASDETGAAAEAAKPIKQAPTQIPTSENFTTKGKPTKTIQTPNGPVEIYDPAQDPEVRAAFNAVYARGDVTFGDLSRYNTFFRTGPYPAPYPGAGSTGNDPIIETEIVRRAREIQYNDMMRVGCRFIKTKPQLSYGSSYLKTPCKNSEMGTLPLSACETENLDTFMERGEPAWQPSDHEKEKLQPKTRRRIFREETYPAWKRKEPYNYPQMVRINRIPILKEKLPNIPTLLIGKISNVSKAETFELLTFIECQGFNKNFETLNKP